MPAAIPMKIQEVSESFQRSPHLVWPAARRRTACAADGSGGSHAPSAAHNWSPLTQRLSHLPVDGEERRSFSARHTTRITLDSGTITGRLVSMCGQIGVRQNAATDGKMIGPPADSEYAVDPVGVATISPSAL